MVASTVVPEARFTSGSVPTSTVPLTFSVAFAIVTSGSVPTSIVPLSTVTAGVFCTFTSALPVTVTAEGVNGVGASIISTLQTAPVVIAYNGPEGKIIELAAGICTPVVGVTVASSLTHID
jgi:hypothetical protein